MFKRILVPIDGSGNARQALDTACQMAARDEAKLILLHVVAKRSVPPELQQFAEVEHLDKTSLPHALGERIVEAAAAHAMEVGVDSVVPLIKEGDPAGVILRTAEEEASDLIIMGSRGLGTVKELLLGSVSHKVTQMAPCACMTVR